MDLVKKVKDYIHAEGLFQADDKLLVAVSGGLDSMTLLDILRNLGFAIHVAHVNYHLRGQESDLDEKLVQEYCNNYHLPCHVLHDYSCHKRKEAALSIQELAREVRYDFFNKILKEEQLDIICTAHHLDDRIETFFMNVCRGAGLTGLQSIRSKNRNIRRPLLNTTREAISEYATNKQLLFREDQSNSDDRYLRNYWRQNIIPNIKKRHPVIQDIMLNNFKLWQEYEAIIEANYTKWLKAHNIEDQELIPFNAIETQEQRHYFRRFIMNLGWTDDEASQMLHAVDQQSTGKFWNSEHLHAAIERNGIRITSLENMEALVPVRIENLDDLKEHHTYFTVSTTPSSQNGIVLDTTKLVFPLTIRSRQEGDFFYPTGMQGKKQRIKKFLINEKIERQQKDRIPLLINGDGQVIWIVGYRGSDPFLTSAEEGLVLESEL